MPFIWNDDTFWNRVKSENSNFLKIDLPLYLINILFWGIFVFKQVSLFELLFLSYCTYSWIYNGANIFFQVPHFKIPDSYSKNIRTVYYVWFFLLSTILLYFIMIGVLQHHYEFFKNLVCCDFLREFDIRGILPS